MKLRVIEYLFKTDFGTSINSQLRLQVKQMARVKILILTSIILVMKDNLCTKVWIIFL